MTKTYKPGTVILIALIGATLLLIWGHSLMPATSSQAESETIRWLLSLLVGEGPVAAFLLTHIRKVAHFGEFFLLGGEVAALRQRCRLPLAWLYGAGVAAADELLQFLSPGRAPQGADVLLDFCGYLCGFAVVAALLWSVKKCRQNKNRICEK